LRQGVRHVLGHGLTHLIHPVAGPAVHAALAPLGVSPGLADLTDQRGNRVPIFYSTGEKASSNPVKFVGRPLVGMLTGLNPMGQSAFENSWGKYAGDRTGTEKTMAVLFHMIPVISNVFQSANPGLDRKYMGMQRKAIEREELKESLK